MWIVLLTIALTKEGWQGLNKIDTAAFQEEIKLCRALRIMVMLPADLALAKDEENPPDQVAFLVYNVLQNLHNDAGVSNMINFLSRVGALLHDGGVYVKYYCADQNQDNERKAPGALEINELSGESAFYKNVLLRMLRSAISPSQGSELELSHVLFCQKELDPLWLAKEFLPGDPLQLSLVQPRTYTRWTSDGGVQHAQANLSALQAVRNHPDGGQYLKSLAKASTLTLEVRRSTGAEISTFIGYLWQDSVPRSQR
eukprot:g56155.t1